MKGRRVKFKWHPETRTGTVIDKYRKNKYTYFIIEGDDNLLYTEISVEHIIALLDVNEK